MDFVESDTDRERSSSSRPLASLGNDSHFLDAILGEILQPQLQDALARERAWGRRRGVPSAPPLEVEVDGLDIFQTPELSPINAQCSEPTAPEPDCVSCSESAPEGSPTSARLLELVTALADNLTPPPPDPCEMTRCDSWEFASLRVPEELTQAFNSESTLSSFESLSRVLEDISPRNPCRASMYVSRSQAHALPERPRSASPSLAEHITDHLSHSEDDADSHATVTLEERPQNAE